MNKLKSMKPITQTALGAFIFFLFWRGYLIMRFKGLYVFDEMYHISSSDAYFHSISEPLLAHLSETDKPCILLLGPHTTSKLNRMDPDIMLFLYETPIHISAAEMTVRDYCSM